MSDVMIRELSYDGHVKVGDAVVLSSHSDQTLDPADGHLGLSEAMEAMATEHKHSGHRGRNNVGHDWLVARNRLQAVQAMAAERLAAAWDFARLRGQAWMDYGSLTERLSGLCLSATGQMGRWQSAMEQRVSGWRHFAMTQQEMWLVAVSDLWAGWRHDMRLRWMVLHSCLMEQLTAAQDLMQSQRVAWWQWFRHLMRVLRAFHTRFCVWLAQNIIDIGRCVRSRLPAVWLPFGENVWRYRLRGARQLGCTLQRFSWPRKDDLVRCCQAFYRSDGDIQIGEDIMLLWEEPRVRTLIVALFFAFAVVSEIVAASYLPIWCASATASDIGVREMMASATMSHSVLNSLKGAAAVI